MRKATATFVTALLASLLLVSCNEGSGTDSQAAGTQPAEVPQAQAQQLATTPPPALQDDSGELRHLGYCVEFCSKCGDSRGTNTAPPRDEPVRVNIDFREVHYNDDPEADMSVLDFEMVGVWKNRERMRTHLSMDHRSQDDFPSVDVGVCRLHVEPLLSEVVETAIRKRGANDYKTYGAFKVTVTDPGGELVGEFPLDGKGAAGEAQWQNTKESRYHVGKAWKRDTDEWRFDIRRMDEFREQQYDAPVLFGLVFQSDGTISHEAFGPDNSRHEYRFPTAAVDIYTPEAILAAQLASDAKLKAEREVEYARGYLPEPITPVFLTGGGGYSGGGGGCGGGG